MENLNTFNDFITEKNFQVVVVAGDDESYAIKYRLSYRYGQGGILAMASSNKDNDKEIEIGDPSAIGKDIEDTINRILKKYRQSFTVEQDHGYQGAGYSFYINMDYILKLLNK
jgi:3-hydroxy-3-methylglutaryl CoA synthase